MRRGMTPLDSNQNTMFKELGGAERRNY